MKTYAPKQTAFHAVQFHVDEPLPPLVKSESNWWMPPQGGIIQQLFVYRIGWDEVKEGDYIIYADGKLPRVMNQYEFEGRYEVIGE